MPQPWMIVTPKRSSKASMRDWGTAAPPAVMPRTVEKSIGVSRASKPFQIVGTPQASVGWNSLKMAARASPMRNICGMIMSVPAIQAP